MSRTANKTADCGVSPSCDFTARRCGVPFRSKPARLPSLFDPPEIRPHFADAADVPRLTEQNTKMLAFLRLGPATNRQLMAIGMNYRARISELREWLQNNTGETIRCIRGKGGLNSYRIEPIGSSV